MITSDFQIKFILVEEILQNYKILIFQRVIKIYFGLKLIKFNLSDCWDFIALSDDRYYSKIGKDLAKIWLLHFFF